MKFESDARGSLAAYDGGASQQITPLDSGLCYSVTESRCFLNRLRVFFEAARIALGGRLTG